LENQQVYLRKPTLNKINGKLKKATSEFQKPKTKFLTIEVQESGKIENVNKYRCRDKECNIQEEENLCLSSSSSSSLSGGQVEIDVNPLSLSSRMPNSQAVRA